MYRSLFHEEGEMEKPGRIEAGVVRTRGGDACVALAGGAISPRFLGEPATKPGIKLNPSM